MPEVADQRPVPANLTYRNVDAFPFWGKFTAETELRGWGTWIRTRINGVRVSYVRRRGPAGTGNDDRHPVSYRCSWICL